ncbi:MAG: adenylate kinase [Ardenticatenia bacterium]|nr:adenylate kinase [Ardenticatenia bacterium]
MNIVLLGAPGSGKGTQAKALGQRLGLLHVASGDLFRHHLGLKTLLGELAGSYMVRGELVPDDVTIRMIAERLAEADAAGGVLLDGFPRTAAQAAALDAMLAVLGQTADGAVLIDVPDAVIITRISGRLVCPTCQTPYHRSLLAGDTCPADGALLERRADDAPEKVGRRLEIYHEQIGPVLSHYRATGRLHEVPGEGSVAEISAAVAGAIDRIRQGR